MCIRDRELGFAAVVQLLHPVQEALRREINPVVYSLAEFRHRAVSGDSFIQEVLTKPKLFVVGNENELGKLTQD